LTGGKTSPRRKTGGKKRGVPLLGVPGAKSEPGWRRRQRGPPKKGVYKGTHREDTQKKPNKKNLGKGGTKKKTSKYLWERGAKKTGEKKKLMASRKKRGNTNKTRGAEQQVPLSRKR